MTRKILVSGLNGMVGTYLKKIFETNEVNFEIADRNNFELSNHKKIKETLNEYRPDILIHLSAETNVDLCEKNPEIAIMNNYESVKLISKICNDIGTYFIFVSTSNVFGSDNRIIYNELDIPSPLNYYGKSKLKAEESINKYNSENSLIIRAGWMIGGGIKKDKKFFGNIVRQINDNPSKDLIAVNDRFGTLTRASLLAEFINKSIDNRFYGTIHFASLGVTSRYEIAKKICQKLKFKGNLIGAESSMFPLPAPRPFSEGIKTLYNLGDYFTENNEVSIEKYIKEFYEN